MLPLAVLGDKNCFDYSSGSLKNIKVGNIVKVPFGNRGFVWGVVKGQTLNSSKRKLKEIFLESDLPSLSKKFLQFLDWVSQWTMTNPGGILKLALSSPNSFEKAKAKEAYIISPLFSNARNLNELMILLPKIKFTDPRIDIFNVLLNSDPVLTKKLLSKSGSNRSVLKTLEKLNLIKKVSVLEKDEEEYFKEPKIDYNKVQLTNHQQTAANFLISQVKKQRYKSIFLDGVTGSGKTEVYFEAVSSALSLRKQVLILLPEISLSSVWIERFKSRFGVSPAVWNSSLTAKIRNKTWREVALGRVNVVVGARSALFLPFTNLGLIIIDEEHDHSFKQEEGVLYQARDMSLIRARIYNCPIILASATPSLETWVNTASNRYLTAKLPKRIGLAQMPEISIVDMRAYNLDAGNSISPPLNDEIKKKLHKNELVMLFLNKRGYAPLKLCRNCGYRVGCPNCQSWLVEHKHLKSFLCHQCGFTKNIEKNCPECGGEDTMLSCGPGVERLEEEVNIKFPDYKTAILSSDTIKDSETMNKFLNDIEEQRINIIIGTQIVSKGHNFKRLTLVGILDADLGLSGGDLRASEKTFQTLHQVSGRAGREDILGKVIIQTYDPNNQTIKALSKNDRDLFLEIERNSRESSGMPPFGRLAALVLSSKDEALLNIQANIISRSVPNFKHVKILGPAIAPLSILRGRYRLRFLIKASRDVNLQKLIKDWLSKINLSSSVKLVIDIDPYSFM